MKNIFLLVLILSLTNCKSSGSRIKGLWLIEEFKIRSFDETNYLSHNLITFNKAGECFVPYYKNKTSDYGKWEVDNGKLIISNTNSIFDETFKLDFKDDKNVNLQSKLIYMSLKSVYFK